MQGTTYPSAVTSDSGSSASSGYYTGSSSTSSRYYPTSSSGIIGLSEVPHYKSILGEKNFNHSLL